MKYSLHRRIRLFIDTNIRISISEPNNPCSCGMCSVSSRLSMIWFIGVRVWWHWWSLWWWTVRPSLSSLLCRPSIPWRKKIVLKSFDSDCKISVSSRAYRYERVCVHTLVDSVSELGLVDVLVCKPVRLGVYFSTSYLCTIDFNRVRMDEGIYRWRPWS